MSAPFAAAARPAPPDDPFRCTDRAHLALGLSISLLVHGAGLAGLTWFWRIQVPEPEMVVSVSLLPGVAPSAAGAAATAGARDAAAATPPAAEEAAPRSDSGTAPATEPAAASAPLPQPRQRARRSRPVVAAVRDVPAMASPPQAEPAPTGTGGAVESATGAASPVPASPGMFGGDASVGAAGDVPAAFDGLGNPPPRYPALARQRKEQGRVILRVTVDAGGGVAAVSVSQSSGSRLLDDAAVDAVRRWRFRPARRGGSAVAAQVEVPILFRLAS